MNGSDRILVDLFSFASFPKGSIQCASSHERQLVFFMKERLYRACALAHPWSQESFVQ